jgi:hypothetical protein
MLVYLGESIELFAERFSTVGDVFEVLRTWSLPH